ADLPDVEDPPERPGLLHVVVDPPARGAVTVDGAVRHGPFPGLRLRPPVERRAVEHGHQVRIAIRIGRRRTGALRSRSGWRGDGGGHRGEGGGDGAKRSGHVWSLSERREGADTPDACRTPRIRSMTLRSLQALFHDDRVLTQDSNS